MTQADFLQTLSRYYQEFGRDMPWRTPESDGTFDAYKILVSEIMLQQTQVKRVIPKYEAFISQFPSIDSLSRASLADVLKLWVGLGYNRRAKYLWQAAQNLQSVKQPLSYEALVANAGFGPNTAKAVLAYAYNQPVIFLETNIRTVLIHHFFADQSDIQDKVLAEKLEALVPWMNNQNFSPREFYWAMMDYGSYLKASIGNLSKQSKTYAKQSKFHGSNRQIRGHIISLLSQQPLSPKALQKEINDERVEEVCNELLREKLILLQGNTLMLYNGVHN